MAELNIGYCFGRKLGSTHVAEKIIKKQNIAGIIYSFVKSPRLSSFVTRLIPLPVPRALFSMFFGATKVPFPSYLLFSLLGLSGIMVPYVVAGESVTDPLSKEFLLPILCGVAVGALALLIYKSLRTEA